MVDGCRSKVISIVSRVPQGSVFSLLLFLLYTSERFSILENKLIGFAYGFTLMAVSSSSSSSSGSSSNKTDRWVHFQQNAGLRLFVYTRIIVHDIDDCDQLTRTFWGFSAQCLSKLFLKEFTVLLVTT